MHGGVPVELLYWLVSAGDASLWRVRPLFVEGEDRNELFSSHDAISYIHTRAQNEQQTLVGRLERAGCLRHARSDLRSNR